MQCRAEVVARLVQARGPPAAQKTGRTIIHELLQMAVGVAQIRCAPVPLWHLLCIVMT